MLDIKVNNHFYNYVVDINDTKTYEFKQVAKNKHINIFMLYSLTTKPKKLFKFQKSLIILTLLKHCPIIYRRKIVYPPRHLN